MATAPSKPGSRGASSEKSVTSEALIGGAGGSVNRHLVALFLVITFVVAVLIGRYAPWDDLALLPKDSKGNKAADGVNADPLHDAGQRVIDDVFAALKGALTGDDDTTDGNGNAADNNATANEDPRKLPPHAADPAFWADRPLRCTRVIDGLTIVVVDPRYDGERVVRLFGLERPAEPQATKTWRSLPGMRLWLKLSGEPVDAEGRLQALVFMIPKNWKEGDPAPTNDAGMCLNAYLVDQALASVAD